MLLALLALAVVAAILLLPLAARSVHRYGHLGRSPRRRGDALEVRDPGRERRAEQRARELLRSCVNREEWAMYRDLGFLRIYGRLPAGAPRGARAVGPAMPGSPRRPGSGAAESPPAADEPGYAYLVYPHKPIVAYVPRTRALLSEYCVEFPDLTSAISHSRLPDSDDVLAKWMALTGDEQRLIRSANMHLPGRQIDPARVKRDLWRLSEWERQRRDSTSFEARNT